jgi:hypothetical protein
MSKKRKEMENKPLGRRKRKEGGKKKKHISEKEKEWSKEIETRL